MAALSLLSLAAGGCNPLTLPARAIPLETAQPVGEGRTGEQISYARDIDGAQVEAGTLGVRRGLDADTDVSVEATGWALPTYAKHTDPTTMRVWSGRAGIKRRITRGIALEAGAGGGLILGAPFVGPDVAAIAAWENGVVVPFAALRGAASVPLVATLTDPRNPNSKLLPDGYGQLAVGLRIPIGWTPAKPGELRGSLTGAFARTGFVDPRGSGWIDGFAVGGEVSF